MGRKFVGEERLDLSVSGSAVRIRDEVPRLAPNPWLGRPTRGRITSFSDASRSRMMLASNRLPVGSPHFLVTLTYPAEFPTELSVIKADRRTFMKRLQRAFPSVVVLWKLEFQRRGAPHYHLIVANSGASVAGMREWVRRAWYEVVGSGDERHLMAGTQVDRLRSTAAYLCGYLKKFGRKSYQDEAPEWAHGLRRWGIVGAPWEVVASGVGEVVEALETLAVRDVGWWGWTPGFVLSLLQPPRKIVLCHYALDS